MSDRFSHFDWDDLRFFLAIARAGSLRGAADKMAANHTTVSRRLGTLEQALGTRLFDRMKDGLQLTQLGEELWPYASRIEEEIVSASRLVAGHDTRPSGPVYVSLPPFVTTTSIMSDIADFSEEYDQIEIHLDVTNTRVDLSRREADVALRMAYEVTEDVVGRRVTQCAKAVYCSPAYAERIQEDGGMGLHWIGWMEKEGDKTASWIKKSPFPNATLRHRTNEAVPHLALAAAGVGLTYLPCFMGDAHPGIIRAPFQEPVPDRSLWMLLHSDLRHTARIRTFIDFMVQRIRSRRSEFNAGLDI